MIQRLRQLFCALHGHDALLHFEKGRLSLLCHSCGYETPGWDLRATPTANMKVLKFRSDRRRQEQVA